MARQLTGRFDVSAVNPVDSTHWAVTAFYYDETGTYGPGDVAVGQRVFLYSSADNTLRYKISGITSNGSNPVHVTLQWDDTGAALDPPANTGLIAAVSSHNLLPEEPSYTQQLLDEPLVAGMRSQTNRAALDNISGGGNQKIAVAGEAFASGKPLAKDPTTGKVLLADSDGLNRQDFYGISASVSAGNGSLVTVITSGTNVAGILTGLGFIVGDEIFIGETPGIYVNGAGTDLFTGANDTLYKLGVADCAAGIAATAATDLILFPEIIARP
jgi:hypothetical protein